MPREDDGWYPGMLAAQDAYNPDEGAFQHGIRQTPWFTEFVQREGEPNLNDPNYDYRAAWKAGARPDVRDPGDGTLHWPSAYKGENHPNRYVNGVDTMGGVAQMPAAEAAASRLRAPYAKAYSEAQQRPTVLRTLATGLAGYPEDLARRAVQNSQFATETGTYDPAVPLEAATAAITGGMPFAQGGAVGMAGGKLRGPRPEVNPGFAPGSAFEMSPPPAALTDPKLRAKAEAVRGTYPQYATQYPETGPPALKANLPDPKNPGKFLAKPAKGEIPYASMDEALARSGEPGFFLEKKLTPAAERFQKDRNLIQQEMDLHGYEPYFDPKKRFDVKGYGPFEDTAVTASPKTAAKQAEWEKIYGTQEIRDRLRAGFEEGKKIPESDRWYFMGQLEKEYVKELGPAKGREAFKKEFADMMAATTGGAAPYDNF